MVIFQEILFVIKKRGFIILYMGFTWDLHGILYFTGIYMEFLWDLNGTANRILWDM